jgi:hypothetical protein
MLFLRILLYLQLFLFLSLKIFNLFQQELCLETKPLLMENRNLVTLTDENDKSF